MTKVVFFIETTKQEAAKIAENALIRLAKVLILSIVPICKTSNNQQVTFLII
jgi:hypothetical protein